MRPGDLVAVAGGGTRRVARLGRRHGHDGVHALPAGRPRSRLTFWYPIHDDECTDCRANGDRAHYGTARAVDERTVIEDHPYQGLPDGRHCAFDPWDEIESPVDLCGLPRSEHATARAADDA